jgi:beta-lactamase class A
MQQLSKDLKPIIKRADMDMGICAIDLDTNERIDVKSDKRMVAASMIKLAVAASFLEAVEEGTLSLDDTYTLKEKDFVEGTGTLGNENPGTKITYEELFEMMIAESDNTAANILIKAVGMKTVNDTAKRLDLGHTKLNRLMMDEEAIANHVENRMSANDAARIFELIWRGELVSPEASRFALEALEAQTDGQGIIQGLPADVVFAHKTGTLPQVRNDGGIVEAERPYVLVVLCAGGEETASLELMTRISELVYAQSQAA